MSAGVGLDGIFRAKLLSPDTDQLLDITIELKDERPDVKMQLKVTADIKEVKYEIKESKEKVICRVSHEKMSVHLFCSLFRCLHGRQPVR